MNSNNAKKSSNDGPCKAIDYSTLKFTSHQKTYDFLVQITSENGVFLPQYSVALHALASDLVLLAKTLKSVKKDGFAYEVVGTNGEPLRKPNPDGEAYHKLVNRIQQTLDRFGWNPKSAKQIETDKESPATALFEALGALLGGGDLEDEFKA